ncbi:zf-CCHC domain-containing protein [Tanacetum coccineum]
MATFEVLDKLIEIIGSTELHKHMRFWFVQEIAEEEGFLRFLCDRSDDLRRRRARRRVLIGEMEALGARGVAVDSLDCRSPKVMWNIMARGQVHDDVGAVIFIFNTIITSLKELDESFSSRNHVRKFLWALPTKWRLKKEKYKSLALKARKVLSEEEASSLDSEDEEYAMAVRDFKKFFRRRGKFVCQPHDDKKNFRKVKEDKKEKEDRRCFKCGDPNHFISDCPTHSFNDQKAFVVGCWSDSKEDTIEEY